MGERELTENEAEWEQQFVTLPNFHEIRDLSFLIREPSSTPEAVKRYMVKHKIPINSYLPVIKGVSVLPGRYLPLFHHLCMSPKYLDLLQHLLRKGCNVSAPVREENPTDLLYLCSPCYLKLLISLGHHLPRDTLKSDLRKRFRMGQSERVVMLFRLGEIDEETIRDVLLEPTFLPDILSVLVDRVYHLCECDETNDHDIVMRLIHQYRKVVRFAIRNGADPNGESRTGCSVLQYAVDYYLVEIVEELLSNAENLEEGDYRKINLVFHKEKNEVLTAVMRQLFNDKRYDDLCKLLHRENDHLPHNTLKNVR